MVPVQDAQPRMHEAPGAPQPATPTKTYDVTQPHTAAEELRAELAGLNRRLPGVSFAELPQLLVECEAMRRWMRAVSGVADVGLRNELAVLTGIMDTAMAAQRQAASTTGPGADRNLFAFAEVFYNSFENLVQSVDRLQELYGKDLDGMGIHLPMIVAVGKESAGKSSVMEMIAGQPFFPRDEGVCTRLPFRLQFRRSQQLSVRFQDIEGGSLDSAQEVQDRIAAITRERTNNEDVSTEEVVLNIEKGDVPELTLVDLPGLIGSSYTREKGGLRAKVARLVKSYVEKPHAIVLAVASADSRLRDSEIFDMVKEAGAEERTIGLLTKCDLASDKRHRLEEKLAGRLDEVELREQERYGYIPLKNGYYGMICRDTMREDRPGEYAQTQEAMEAAKARETETFDEIVRNPEARVRCGVANVYKALSNLLQRYIQETWRPDTMQKTKDRIIIVQQSFDELKFSERFPQPPTAEDASTPDYRQELRERISSFSEQFRVVLCSYELADDISEDMSEAGEVPLGDPNSAGSAYTGIAQFALGALQPFEKAILAALDKMGARIQQYAHLIITEYPQTRSLPRLQAFIFDYIREQVKGAVEEARGRMGAAFELERAAPLPGRSGAPESIRVSTDVASPGANVTILLVSEENCPACTEDLRLMTCDLMRCCGRHFHRQCLDELSTGLRPKAVAMCPNCNTPFGDRLQIAPDVAARRDAAKHLDKAQSRLAKQTKRAAALALYRLQALNLTGDLGQLITGAPGTNTNHLLAEAPEVQAQREELARTRVVLESVERAVKEWGEL
eukprot:NODE_810_length_2755_cov_6.319635.p1 GENE.NODE_810_length_2755_cov_6.319635~~NODE_810_length_2755_cov_6.319635.p1  ORF type:complete len:826 (+),score=283.39 NODE_810_length_2755_cov_6.319635:105-2480(+)